MSEAATRPQPPGQQPVQSTSQPQPSAKAVRGHRALSWLFAGLGLLSGAWGVHIGSVQAAYELSDGGLSLILLAAGLGAIASLFVGGRVVAHWGTRRTLLITGVVMQASLAAVLVWPHVALLAAAMVGLGMVISVHDVALNAEGTALETVLGRPVMGGLHAQFSFGAMAGALLCALLLRLKWAPALQLAAVGGLLLPLVVGCSARLLDAHPAVEGSGGRHFVWPRGRLLLIGLLILCGMVAEGVMMDWSVLYLQEALQWPQDRAALGYAAFVGAMALARAVADRARTAWGDPMLLKAGAATASAAMVLALMWPGPWVSLLAFAAVGAGLAPVVPLLYTAAAREPGRVAAVADSSSAAALAAVSSIGYAGFVVGPPLIGALAEAFSLPMAMWTVALAAGGLALGAVWGLRR